MGRDESKAALRVALEKRPNGLTASEAATVLKVPVRTARRYLAELHAAGQATRIATYHGEPPVFAWRYRA